MKLISLVCSVFVFAPAICQTTLFEQSGGTQTPTYQQAITWWQKLDQQSGKVKMLTMGMTDAGFPLHLVVVSNNGDYNFESIRKRNKRRILINNGIHPGEPDGIDASMLLVRDIVAGKVSLPDDIVLAFIPVYNIGGALNRSAYYRVDQNGPEEFGFRGNSQNFDLNRDFIKNDTRDARAFVQIFHLVDPDVFIDNHVSNGADYQHVMTLIASQHNRLGGGMGEFMQTNFEPGLYSLMKAKGFDLIPYVNSFRDTPESGWTEFWDSPRYGSGYASLWNTFAFVPETHMLKPYKQRVEATYALMKSFIEFTHSNNAMIARLRSNAKNDVKSAQEFPIDWKLDSSRQSQLTFKGYKSGRKTSDISGLPRLYYDRAQPFTAKVPFYNYYNVTASVKKPDAYIIPQGWWKVIELLQLNKISMRRLTRDTTIEVESYRIDRYQSSARPYEGHHPNGDVGVSSRMHRVNFKKGDYFIPMNQEGNRFLFEVLEPHAEDSYFTWNFFDPILDQKEGFSHYVFEETAAQLLKENPELKTKLDQRKQTDSTFAKNGRAQLNFIYQQSRYFEPSHLQYPVYRLISR